MTDKQIIIDGIDMSGCSYGEIEKDVFKCSCEYNVRSASMFCKDNPNCYYKQLKAKEQECEELKRDLHKNFEEKDKLHLIIDRLLEASGYDANTASAEDFEDVYENMRYEKQQLDQLKQTLAEIKEIAEKHKATAHCDYLTDIEQILQKIGECEVGNEN